MRASDYYLSNYLAVDIAAIGLVALSALAR
jgi:hypothetical protein